MRVKYSIPFLLLCVTPCLSVEPAPSSSSLKTWRKPAADRERRIIFDNDGNEAFHITAPDRQQFLDARTSALAGSHVDSIFYCANACFGHATRSSKVWQIFTAKVPHNENNFTQELIDAGLDPLQLIVEFGKEHGIEVFTSIRMNDTHDGGSNGYGPIRFGTNQLKSEHPEFLLGTKDNRPKHGSWTAVNYTRPEIRESMFRFVEEACRNYDIDGVSLDFFRHPVFFPSTARGEPATSKECDLMTELIARIRRMADEVGQARNRPLLVAVRTPDSVEYCKAIGLDLEKWMKDDLIDLLVVSSYFQLNDWPYTVELGKRYSIPVYPSLDESRVRDESAQAIRNSPLAYRGRAANVWLSGADGVYLFNFFNPHSSLWRELGDPAKLSAMDKDYFGSSRGAVPAAGGNLPYGAFQAIETLNPTNPKRIAPGKSTTSRIRIGESWTAESPVHLTLRLQFREAVRPQDVQVVLNAQRLDTGSASDDWIEFAAPHWALRAGENKVKVSLDATVKEAIEWTDLVLQVRHSSVN